MGVIGGSVGYKLLKLVNPGGESDACDGSAYKDRSKIEALFGKGIWDRLRGKVIIDFGCGTGEDAIEIAQRGASRVIGIDIRENVLSEAREAARRAQVSDRCTFSTGADEKADVVLSMDSFEHFDDPAGILKVMRRIVKDNGRIIIGFMPWYHPLGGHLFSVFPWAHLVFTEKALIRWRSDFKSDGATRFCEVEGGLNQMSIRRFKRLVSESEFQFEHFETVPIRRMHLLSKFLPREFFTSIVRCRLVPRKGS